MPDDFDLVDGVRRAAVDRQGAWDFLDGFVTRWLDLDPLTAGADTEAELAAAEARLGVVLPAAVREAYALLADRDDLVRVQDRLLAPGDLRLDAAGAVLVWREENQVVSEWGVALADLHREDPPVLVRYDMDDDGSWMPFLDSFSLACVDMVLSEALMDEADGCHSGALDEESAAVVESSFTRLAVPAYPTADPGVRWFAGPGVVLRDDDRSWLWVRARDEETLEKFCAAVPADWEAV